MDRKIRFFIVASLFLLTACLQETSVSENKTNFLSNVDWEELDQADEQFAETELLKLSAKYGQALFGELRNRDITTIAGYINSDFLKQLRELPPETSTIAIYSTGGLAETALEAANLIRSRDLIIVIFGSCNSACAEYILPAAKQVIFFDDPLVGVHGDMNSMKFFAMRDNLKNPCAPTSDPKNMIQKLDGIIESKRKLYTETGHNINFWKAQIQRLGTAEFVTTSMDTKECVYIQQFPFEMWYPTSEQLGTLLGLKFEGTLCADEAICYEKKIPLLTGAGKKYVVGDEEYLSQLP